MKTEVAHDVAHFSTSNSHQNTHLTVLKELTCDVEEHSRRKIEGLTFFTLAQHSSGRVAIFIDPNRVDHVVHSLMLVSIAVAVARGVGEIVFVEIAAEVNIIWWRAQSDIVIDIFHFSNGFPKICPNNVSENLCNRRNQSNIRNNISTHVFVMRLEAISIFILRDFFYRMQVFCKFIYFQKNIEEGFHEAFRHV